MYLCSFPFRKQHASYVVLLFQCSGTDESFLSNVGHHLSGKELLVLKDILQEDVIVSLQQNGLDLQRSEHVTFEKVQDMLHSLERHELASSLKQLLHFGKQI